MLVAIVAIQCVVVAAAVAVAAVVVIRRRRRPIADSPTASGLQSPAAAALQTARVSSLGEDDAVVVDIESAFSGDCEEEEDVGGDADPKPATSAVVSAPQDVLFDVDLNTPRLQLPGSRAFFV